MLIMAILFRFDFSTYCSSFAARRIDETTARMETKDAPVALNPEEWQ